jgi:hypothetical protein
MAKKSEVIITPAEGHGWGKPGGSKLWHFWLRPGGDSICGNRGPWPKEAEHPDEQLEPGDNWSMSNCQWELRKRLEFLGLPLDGPDVNPVPQMQMVEVPPALTAPGVEPGIQISGRAQVPVDAPELPAMVLSTGIDRTAAMLPAEVLETEADQLSDEDFLLQFPKGRGMVASYLVQLIQMAPKEKKPFLRAAPQLQTDRPCVTIMRRASWVPPARRSRSARSNTSMMPWPYSNARWALVTRYRGGCSS